MNETFVLDGSNGPAVQKEDPSAFLPPPEFMTTRQELYSTLVADPNKSWEIGEVAKKLNRSYGSIYSQAKHLVRKGFANKTEKSKWRTKKNGEQIVCGKTITIKGIKFDWNTPIRPGSQW